METIVPIGAAIPRVVYSVYLAPALLRCDAVQREYRMIVTKPAQNSVGVDAVRLIQSHAEGFGRLYPLQYVHVVGHDRAATVRG